MLYQDSEPDLALARDRHEKAVLLPMTAPIATDRVLDIGCGLGRWTSNFAEIVAHYVGTDPIAPLIAIARKKHAWRENVTFHVCKAEELRRECLSETLPFDIILVAGVLHYMNNDGNRLTLCREWSGELDHEYSAIYRSRMEYLRWFEQIFVPNRFHLSRDVPLYPGALNNRRETQQHVFLLRSHY